MEVGPEAVRRTYCVPPIVIFGVGMAIEAFYFLAASLERCVHWRAIRHGDGSGTQGEACEEYGDVG